MKQWIIYLFTPLALILPILILSLSPKLAQAQGSARVEYISPVPGSHFNSPATTIAIRPGDPINRGTVKESLFSVRGLQSGLHIGAVLLAADGRTVIFKPARPFALGETVQVTLASGLQTAAGRSAGSISFDFVIESSAVTAPLDYAEFAPSNSKPGARGPQGAPQPRAPQYVTLPSDYPQVTVTIPATGTADGYIFLTPFKTGSPSYLLIVDNAGQPVYYKKNVGAGRLIDFQKQDNGLLTYWLNSKFYALDNSYNVTRTISAGNGYNADNHDMQMLPNGNAQLLIYDNQAIDLQTLGISTTFTSTLVTGCIVQELDPSNNVVFEWKSWDHFLITDTILGLTGSTLDYVHCNAIEPDQDGNLLLSSRHLSEVTKIDRQDGHIIWRLNGKNNQFTFLNDNPPYFTEQHDIRRLANGDITLFDNGVDRTPQYSRGVEYQLDEISKTATLIWQFDNNQNTYGFATGDTQRLANGNTFIGWGTTGLMTEVKPDNSKALEVTIQPQASYRALKYTWHGYPTTQPTLVFQNLISTILLTTSWNGATDIASYQIYKGSAPQPTTLVTAQPRTGFETSISLPCDPSGTRYYRVMPVDLNGQPTQYSNDVTVPACLQNMLPLIIK